MFTDESIKDSPFTSKIAFHDEYADFSYVRGLVFILSFIILHIILKKYFLVSKIKIMEVNELIMLSYFKKLI